MTPDSPPGLDLSVSGRPEEEGLQAVWHSHLCAWLEHLAPPLPPHLKAETYSLGLTLCDDEEMGALNREWRGLEGPTDVLAFAIQEAPIPLPRDPLHLDAGIEGLEPSPAMPLELGDIVISRETAWRQAESEGHSRSRELLFLASHGLLHLLGWDHPDDSSLAAMLHRQEELLALTAHLPMVAPDPCDGQATG
jgi:probable rRNA maturation factor